MTNINPDVVYYPKEAVLKAVKQFPTPFYIYSEKRIRENCRRFSGAFKKYFPDFSSLYAIKANSNSVLLKIIAEEGFGMDASSDFEVFLSNQLGLNGMFTANFTPAQTLKYAKENGFILNLDDISNIAMLTEIGVPEMVSLRINPGMGNAVEASNVFAGPDAKYGIPFEKAPQAYSELKKLGVKKFGIHMMTGSNVPIDKKDYFAEIIAKLLEVVAQTKAETGIEIEVLNMGGGFGVPYHPEKPSLDMDYIAKSVRESFDTQCAKYNLKAPRLMAEPGRYIVADAGWLVSKVVVIKDSYKKFIGVDASTNDNPRPAIYDAYHYVSLISDEQETEIVSVVGSICENNDQFAKERVLPKAKVGDIVVIHNSGGHVYAMAHNYNGKLKHAEYLLKEDGSLSIIRRAETFNDLLSTLTIN